jgi:hypothetical protein
VFGQVLSRHVLGEMGEEDLPLPLSAPKDPPFRTLKEAYYEAGAQIAHFTGDRF